jgi:hypothetical protein
VDSLSSAADAGMWCGRYTSVVGPARRCFQRSARIANVCTSWRTASRAAVSRGFGRPGSSPPARATRRSRVRSEVHRAYSLPRMWAVAHARAVRHPS